MAALDMMTQNIDGTTGKDEQEITLGSIDHGSAITAAALRTIPELREAAQIIATLGGDESEPVDNPQEEGQDSQGGYTGTVDFDGTQVEIKNGIGDDGEGNQVYVSPDGAVVADKTGRILGRVENGKFVMLDKSHADMLEKNKMAERGAK
jgi:hypothetical protein